MPPNNDGVIYERPLIYECELWTHQVILVAKHMRPRQVKHANRVIKRTPGENDLISLITNMQG